MTTKQNITDLISRLASKELSFGCEVIINGTIPKIVKTAFDEEWRENVSFVDIDDVQHDEKDITKIIGHPVLLTTVLAKMDFPPCEQNVVSYEAAELTNLWHCCGFTKSLQTIAEESGWEDCFACYDCDLVGDFDLLRTHEGRSWDGKIAHQIHPDHKLKNPKARELFTFILTIFPK